MKIGNIEAGAGGKSLLEILLDVLGCIEYSGRILAGWPAIPQHEDQEQCQEWVATTRQTRDMLPLGWRFCPWQSPGYNGGENEVFDICKSIKLSTADWS